MNDDIAVSTPPNDAQGYKLRVGQEVILTPSATILRNNSREQTRMLFAGQRSTIISIYWKYEHGGYWWVQLARDWNSNSEYARWPALCVTGVAQGLKGLVARYREQVRT